MGRKKAIRKSRERSNQLLKEGRYDKFIQDNIYLLTNEQIKEIIKVDYMPLEERILELIGEGKIDRDTKIDTVFKDIDKTQTRLKIGHKYKILTPNGKDKITEAAVFRGICIAEYKSFYLFKTESGYRESFLKADLYTGEKLCVRIDWYGI